MTAALIVLRPEPGAGATLRRIAALGRVGVAAPLFRTVAIDWTAPSAPPAAVMMTSAAAARLGGSGLDTLLALPLFAVGTETARAASARGFGNVRVGGPDAAALARRIAADGFAHALHLAGREVRAFDPGALAIERVIVYAAEEDDASLPRLRTALAECAVVLLHSPRAARRFAALVDGWGIARSRLSLAAISPATLDAAGGGWAATAAAGEPTDAALLAAALRLCDQADRKE